MNKTTKRNIVFITSIKGLVDTSYKEYCLNTWRWWAKKHDVELFVFDEPIADIEFMNPIWQV